MAAFPCEHHAVVQEKFVNKFFRNESELVVSVRTDLIKHPVVTVLAASKALIIGKNKTE